MSLRINKERPIGYLFLFCFFLGGESALLFVKGGNKYCLDYLIGMSLSLSFYSFSFCRGAIIGKRQSLVAMHPSNTD